MDTTFASGISLAKQIFLCLICLVLTACSNGPHYAPVTDIDAIERVLKEKPYVAINNDVSQELMQPEAKPIFSDAKWVWPAKGIVIAPFSISRKGINIKGRKGDAIVAAAAGKVVYCGSGLRGYGNLIIIKHNSLYFSAYAHNQSVFVKDGDLVKQSQKIAEMGNTGTDQTMLHFEIRYAGKPIDPVSLLSS